MKENTTVISNRDNKVFTVFELQAGKRRKCAEIPGRGKRLF
jgi:hypothetical protein